jgi:hypothetical protein
MEAAINGMGFRKFAPASYHSDVLQNVEALKVGAKGTSNEATNTTFHAEFDIK